MLVNSHPCSRCWCSPFGAKRCVLSTGEYGNKVQCNNGEYFAEGRYTCNNSAYSQASATLFRVLRKECVKLERGKIDSPQWIMLEWTVELENTCTCRKCLREMLVLANQCHGIHFISIFIWDSPKQRNLRACARKQLWCVFWIVVRCQTFFFEFCFCETKLTVNHKCHTNKISFSDSVEFSFAVSVPVQLDSRQITCQHVYP